MISVPGVSHPRIRAGRGGGAAIGQLRNSRIRGDALYTARVRAVAIALVLAVSAQAAHAQRDPLAEAIQLEARLDYEAALTIVERELARGVADRERLVTIHMFAGKLAAGLGRSDKAQDHFARVLALSPTTTFAEGTSPKITLPFDAARARTAPLRVTASVETRSISISALPDPNRIVVGIAVQLDRGGELRERNALRVELPAGARVTQVSALDGYGNRVWTERVASATAGDPVEPVDMRTPTLRPLVARWPFWASGTAVALAAGGVCAWRFDKAQTEWNQAKAGGPVELSRLEELEARGKRWALAANISFGVAATTTLIAIITAARGSQTTTIVTARPDAVGLAIAGDF